MLSILHKSQSRLEIIFLTVITSFIFSPAIFAQQLEEIVVTAQRRVQSLQEVPISIQAVSGLELAQNGFRTMEDLGQFAPSVEINESLHEWSVTVRGMGNDVANMSVEQSAPIFVDGIHFGRPSMIKGAFLDLERVEVLTGPQPVYFGQNATAGAFSLTTKKPTETWEGDASAEFGNFGRIDFEGGIGGPITDTFGIRIAGQWDSTGGHLTDAFTGNKFPNRTDTSFRLTTVWKPMENFEVMTKAEYARRRSDGDTNVVCENEFVDLNDLTTNFNSVDVGAVLVEGRAPAYDALFDQRPIPKCSDGFGKFGVQEGTGNFLAPLQGINNDDGRSGALDIRDLAVQYMPDGNLVSREPLDAWNFRLGMKYEFSNGITIESSTGLVDYERETFESTDESPFLMEAARRQEVFDMWSQEIRVSGPSGGQLEWSAGIYYQKENLALSPVVTMRANIVQPQHEIRPFNNSKWNSAFASLTYNFFDDKASIDLGARYSDVKKDGGLHARAATYIFNIDPDSVAVPLGSVDNNGNPVVDVVGDNIIWATQHRPAIGGGDQVRRVADSNIFSCETGLTPQGNRPTTAWTRDPLLTSPHPGRPTIRQCGQYAGMAGYWTHSWRTADIPEAWDLTAPVDLGPLLYGIRRDPGPFQDSYGEDSIDPQITLRYRPNTNHSLYAKWAKAFKAGGFDTSDRGVPRGGLNYNAFNPSTAGNFDDDGQKEFTFLSEKAVVYEIGARGQLFDGRVRYGLTAFYQKIRDLQLETEVADLASLINGTPSTGRFQTNAGAQRTQGIDIELGWAATDRLTFNLAGVIQDGVMLEFIGGCTDVELVQADTNGCFSAAESEALLGPGNTFLEGSYDRSGFKAARTPDWKFIVGTDYEMPLFEKYVAKFNSKLAVSDEYTEDTLGFTRVVRWPVHADLNLLVGIGDAEGTWDINGFARNVLGARQKYYADLEADFRGIVEQDMPASAFFNYGIQFNYHFR